MNISPRNLLTLAFIPLLLACHASAAEIKVLIIDGQNNHAWKQTTPLLRQILEEAGIFSVTVATSPGKTDGPMTGFAPRFSDYDAIVSNYNGQPWPEETRKAFENYVKGGGGFVSVHAADNSFPEWDAYNEMIGVGGWGGRNEKSGPYLRLREGKFVHDTTPGRGGSHGKQHAFQMITRSPNHPIMKGLPARWMHAQDELYDRLRGPARNCEVLASAFSDRSTGGTAEHEPLLIAISYGQGRVFHNALGHSTPAIKCVGFAVTLQRGTEWAATGKVTQATPNKFPTADEVVSW